MSSVCSALCWENYAWNVLTFWKQEEWCSVTQPCSPSFGWWISHCSFPRKNILENWSPPTTHSRLPTPVMSTSYTLSPKRYSVSTGKLKETWKRKQGTSDFSLKAPGEIVRSESVVNTFPRKDPVYLLGPQPTLRLGFKWQRDRRWFYPNSQRSAPALHPGNVTEGNHLPTWPFFVLRFVMNGGLTRYSLVSAYLPTFSVRL